MVVSKRKQYVLEEAVTNISGWPVMKTQCPTCPFQRNGDKQIEGTVRSRAMEVSQICHHPRLHGKPETHLCRGSRDYQQEILHRMGFLSEPTDEAWDNKVKELKF